MNEIKSKEEVYPKRTQSTERTVNRAFTSAIFSGKEYVDCFQLVLSIFGEKNSHALFFMLKNGLTKKTVVDHMTEVGTDVPDETQVNQKQAAKILKNYTVDLNEQAKQNKTFHCIGRHPDLQGGGGGGVGGGLLTRDCENRDDYHGHAMYARPLPTSRLQKCSNF